MRHDWQKIRFIPPSGAANAYYGKKCRACGLKTWQHGRLTRWKYANGHVADTATIEEPGCTGVPASATN